MMIRITNLQRAHGVRSFTLMELLVVMGILGVLSAITAVAYRAVAKDAKMASAKNTIMAVLDNARGLAMKNNEIVMVAFRPRLEGRQQYVEAVLAKWTRQSIPYLIAGNINLSAIDRYTVIPGLAPRRLPAGIKVAGPAYYLSFNDEAWDTLSHLPNINSSGQGEMPGSIICVMYAPDGRNIMYNSKSDATRAFIDFNNDNQQWWGGPLPTGSNVPYTTLAPGVPLSVLNPLFDHIADDDEPCVSPMPYLAVFDDDEVRELYDTTQWNMLIVGSIPAQTNRNNAYREFITNNADRIHFNRYTGVAMK